jgi:hypothetical protein
VRLLAVAACLLPGLAWAEAPPARPLRDVDVTYKVPVPGGANTALLQRYRWSVQAQTQRVDLPTSGNWMVLDFGRHRMSLVHDQSREVVEIPAPPSADQPTDSAAYTRLGTDNVAGLACTQWRTTDTRGAETLACTTQDGVLLRAQSGGKVMMEATSVIYAPQDPTVFQTPADYTHQHSGR